MPLGDEGGEGDFETLSELQNPCEEGVSRIRKH
jgi:hypothetical protein